MVNLGPVETVPSVDASRLRGLAQYLERKRDQLPKWADWDPQSVVPLLRTLADQFDAEAKGEAQPLFPPEMVKALSVLEMRPADTVVVQISEKAGADVAHRIMDGVGKWLRDHHPDWRGGVLVVPGEMKMLRVERFPVASKDHIPVGPNVVRGGEAIRHGASHGWGNVD